MRSRRLERRSLEGRPQQPRPATTAFGRTLTQHPKAVFWKVSIPSESLMKRRRSCWTCSNTKYKRGTATSSTNTSCSRTIFRCVSSRSSEISRIAVEGSPSWGAAAAGGASSSRRISLTAKIVCRVLHRARNTVPYVPLPISSRISNRASRMLWPCSRKSAMIFCARCARYPAGDQSKPALTSHSLNRRDRSIVRLRLHTRIVRPRFGPESLRERGYLVAR